MSVKHSPITVLGAGSWGTALAILLARNDVATRLWGRDAAQLRVMAKERRNSRYLAEVKFPEQLNCYTELASALAGVQDILIAVPSYAFADIIKQLAAIISPQTRIVWATKGLDADTGQLLQRVVEQTLGTSHPLAIISGPSFALEVAEGLPTAVTLASNSTDFAQDLLAKLHSNCFRVYLSDDLLGVQLCGAVKNVLAIATGLTDALAFGANARAALITRGLAEMIRLGLAMGAKQSTFVGLAGMGDLVLTCTGDLSRNRRFGMALGQGLTSAQAEKSIGQAVEGLHNVQQIIKLASQHRVNMPISQQVLAIINEEKTPAQAVEALLSRAPVWEED